MIACAIVHVTACHPDQKGAYNLEECENQTYSDFD